MQKRVLILSDLHCGHVTGLTPPSYQRKAETSEARWNKLVYVQKELWKWFNQTVQKNGPYDLTVVNGDCIDGDGSRSGGTELITTDRLEQAKIACDALATIPTKKFHFTFGTPYHTGNCEDFEIIVAKTLGGKIGSHEWVKVAGLILDLKHHQASSSIPYGKNTPLAKEAFQNELWAARNEQPRADILIRSHVHTFARSDIRLGNRTITAVSTPALQGYGSKYGARKCSGPVDVGLLVLDIEQTKQGTKHHIQPFFADMDCLKARTE